MAGRLKRNLPQFIHHPRPTYVAQNGVKLKREDGKIWSSIRGKWLFETPEEYIRQDYLLVLVHEYGYCLDQIDEEEEVTGRDSAKALADIDAAKDYLTQARKDIEAIILGVKKV